MAKKNKRTCQLYTKTHTNKKAAKEHKKKIKARGGNVEMESTGKTYKLKYNFN